MNISLEPNGGTFLDLCTLYKPVVNQPLVSLLLIPEILFFSTKKRPVFSERHEGVMLSFYSYDHSKWTLAPFFKPEFAHLKQESDHKIYITAHMITFFSPVHAWKLLS